MKCPKCNGDLEVVDSRETGTKRFPEGYVRRVRKCLLCGSKFSSIEFILGETVPGANGVYIDRLITEKFQKIYGADRKEVDDALLLARTIKRMLNNDKEKQMDSVELQK